MVAEMTIYGEITKTYTTNDVTMEFCVVKYEDFRSIPIRDLE